VKPFAAQRNTPAAEVDNRRDHQRSRDETGYGQQCPLRRGSQRDDEQGNSICGRKRAEVARLVGELPKSSKTIVPFADDIDRIASGRSTGRSIVIRPQKSQHRGT
jgi:hypothetical protein